MQEEIIKLETAKLAKEKGFNWKTDSLFRINYSSGKDIVHGEYDIKTSSIYREAKNWNDILEEDFPQFSVSRPTQSLLQKWLREVHNIVITINHWTKQPVNNETWDHCYDYDCYEIEKGTIPHKTYEEALEAALQGALKLIKN